MFKLKATICVALMGVLLSGRAPSQSILPEPMCSINLDSLHKVVNHKFRKSLSREYVLVVVNTAIDKHTMAHLVHYSYVRIRRKLGNIPILWLFSEFLTGPNKRAQDHFITHIARMPSNDSLNEYVFSDVLFKDIWRQIEEQCKHHSSLQIDAFSVMNNNVYDAVRLKTENISDLFVPMHSEGFDLERIIELPDSLTLSPLSMTALLPSGNLIRVERADNKLYYINVETGRVKILWRYDSKEALNYFINVIAWADEVRDQAKKMGLYPPYWNRESFRLVGVKVSNSYLYLTATFEAPCPFERDLRYINVEGDKVSIKANGTWGYCAYLMFGMANFVELSDSIIVTKWRWWATPVKEMPEPYNRYLLGDPESFVMLNDSTIAFVTVNYDWKFERTICYVMPVLCKFRYAIKKKYTHSVGCL